MVSQQFPGQPAPMFDNPFGKDIFPKIQFKPSLVQLEKKVSTNLDELSHSGGAFVGVLFVHISPAIVRSTNPFFSYHYEKSVL